MSGPQSDLRTGLAWQTVMNGPRPYHEAMRLLTLVEAPRETIENIVRNQRHLQKLYDNEWLFACRRRSGRTNVLSLCSETRLEADREPGFRAGVKACLKGG